DPPPARLMGDVDGNGHVEITDARMVLQFLVGKIKLTPEQLACANVDGQSNVTINDARLIIQYVVNKLDEFPVGITVSVPEPEATATAARETTRFATTSAAIPTTVPTSAAKSSLETKYELSVSATLTINMPGFYDTSPRKPNFSITIKSPYDISTIEVYWRNELLCGTVSPNNPPNSGYTYRYGIVCEQDEMTWIQMNKMNLELKISINGETDTVFTEIKTLTAWWS
ncbi:MAG: dockerin type I repeat-containing protein, partial [Oscillospiraceae bacterium]|nr:dockerin type I repeat-containing protein [Oscillospiraceae bacterium]